MHSLLNCLIIKMWISVNSECNAAVIYTTPLYNIHKETYSPSNKTSGACYVSELKTNEEETRDRRRQTSWLPCICVWRLWERCSTTNQPITQTTSNQLTLQLTLKMEGWRDLMLEERQTRIQSGVRAVLKHIITSITSFNYDRITNMCEECRHVSRCRNTHLQKTHTVTGK